MSDLVRILVVLGLVGANAVFVIGEYAVVTARRAALRPRAEAGDAGARAALRLMDDPVRVMSTVQVCITAVGILTGAIGEPLVRDVLGDWIPGELRFALAFAIVTYLSVVFGELVPKALTLEHAEALAAVIARPMELISVVLGPAVWLLQTWPASCYVRLEYARRWRASPFEAPPSCVSFSTRRRSRESSRARRRSRCTTSSSSPTSRCATSWFRRSTSTGSMPS